jgi:hypothetical protein
MRGTKEEQKKRYDVLNEILYILFEDERSRFTGKSSRLDRLILYYFGNNGSPYPQQDAKINQDWLKSHMDSDIKLVDVLSVIFG